MSVAFEKFSKNARHITVAPTKVGQRLKAATVGMLLLCFPTGLDMADAPMVRAPSMAESVHIPSDASSGNLKEKLSAQKGFSYLDPVAQSAISSYQISQENLFATSQMKEASASEKTSVRPYIQAQILTDFSVSAEGALQAEAGEQSLSVLHLIAGNPDREGRYFQGKYQTHQKVLTSLADLLNKNERNHPENKVLPTPLRVATGMQQIYNEQQAVYTVEERRYTATYLWALKGVSQVFASQLPKEQVSAQMGVPEVAKTLDRYHQKYSEQRPVSTIKNKPSIGI